MKKFLALAMAAVMALSLAACGENTETPETTTDAAVVEETNAPVEETNAVEVTEEAASEEATGAAEETSAVEETTEAEAEIDLNTTEGVVEFYKQAAKATDAAGSINASDKMSLESLDGGEGGIGKLISLFEPIAKRALENNSGSVSNITGGYDKLTASDVSSAKAVDDGKYTTITINLKDQVAGMVSPEKEGTVGHGITTLGKVQDAIDELGGVEIDHSNGSITLTYTNAYINVKVDNATGKIVSGNWGYKVNVAIDNVTAKISFISATLNGAKGVVDYKITL